LYLREKKKKKKRGEKRNKRKKRMKNICGAYLFNLFIFSLILLNLDNEGDTILLLDSEKKRAHFIYDVEEWLYWDSNIVMMLYSSIIYQDSR
jgi:hypothetical protein